ncbi:hypothetical protein QG37_02397 [Candidozyma auris]|uniref:Uncharacterized protein n=1 Tax=Candidozyma auris TaxID=498019 RepID=A0A0L0P2V4_CANAR|nr:hypothetical protein QG37_02397 [[Candida] auris]
MQIFRAAVQNPRIDGRFLPNKSHSNGSQNIWYLFLFGCLGHGKYYPLRRESYTASLKCILWVTTRKPIVVSKSQTLKYSHRDTSSKHLQQQKSICGLDKKVFFSPRYITIESHACQLIADELNGANHSPGQEKHHVTYKK